MKQHKLLATIILIVATIAIAQAQPAEPSITTKQITDRFYVLFGGSGLGSNVGMYIGNDGIVLIDSMIGDKSNQKLLSAIRRISDKPIKYVISTHSDSDHSGGNAFFAKKGAAIILQANARYSSASSHINFEEKLTLNIDSETIEAHNVVSHSFDDAIIHLRKSNVILMGDTFTNVWHPTFYSGGMVGQQRTIEKALSLANKDTIVVPGHGLITDKKGLITYMKDSAVLVNKVKELYKKGISANEIAKDEELNRLKMRFNGAKRTDFMPQNRLKRFVERVISTELIDSYSLPLDKLNRYVGKYKFEDDKTLEIVRSGDKLLVRSEDGFLYMAEIVPLSETKFHVKAELDTQVLFKFDRAGSVTRLVYKKADKTHQAERITEN